jgi:hypothetical protein
MTAKASRLAVDIGGTFTDVALETDGKRFTAEMPDSVCRRHGDRSRKARSQDARLHQILNASSVSEAKSSDGASFRFERPCSCE